MVIFLEFALLQEAQLTAIRPGNCLVQMFNDNDCAGNVVGREHHVSAILIDWVSNSPKLTSS